MNKINKINKLSFSFFQRLLNVCTSYILNYIKRMGNMICFFAMTVLARCLNIHVPNAFGCKHGYYTVVKDQS